MRVLVLDNQDSFTHNLVQALEALDAECLVRRSDAIALAEVKALKPQRILISPGPFGPEKAGVCRVVVEKLTGDIPILGVCLGMQVIAAVVGARIRPARSPLHGKTSRIRHDGQGVFEALPNPFTAARYHSLEVDGGREPPMTEFSAWADDGTLMGLRISGLGVEGVQFHPESFLSEHGTDLLFNFLYRSQTW
jgi:anthranilate synthase/aminodeoxychorismate synthase-like glutamine amidotransferase